MSRYLPLLLSLVLALPCVAEDDAAAPAAPANEQRELLKQAFDGAMTCSALTAIKADQATGTDQQSWANRSFAFGMLAVRFYTDITAAPLSNDELNEALNQYADALLAMSPEQTAPFETGCANKYADMDRLCAENECVFPAVPAPESPPVRPEPGAEED